MSVVVDRYEPDPGAQPHKIDHRTGFAITVDQILREDEYLEEGWEKDVIQTADGEAKRIVTRTDEFEGVASIDKVGDGIPNLPGNEYELRFEDERDGHRIFGVVKADLIAENGLEQ